MSLDPRSLGHLQGIRPELVNVIKLASEQTNFRVTEGLRSRERQRMLVKARKSKTMNSRHITGHAIDFIAIGDDGVATYNDADMKRVADVIACCAQEQGVKIERGIDWGWDSPHIELDRRTYPAHAVGPVTRTVESVRDHPKTVATGVVVGAEVLSETAEPVKAVVKAIPAPPDMSWITDWQGALDQFSSLGSWAMAHPIITTVFAAFVGVTWLAPWLAAKLLPTESAS